MHVWPPTIEGGNLGRIRVYKAALTGNTRGGCWWHMARKTAICWTGGIPCGRGGVEQTLKGNWAKEVFDETLPSSRCFLRKGISTNQECTGDVNIGDGESLRANGDS